ncbi:EPIDERMAL PATTERNING FACTOR-like protein 8 [Prosopis cineraria]|uniref:EPIDERMAL PATTERNING FACTOR-like protein 8 n=1 Tax=Prosopis cineraria TaxID=364024 RepID=UPI0024103BF0|nr:EPIDERMAL PATTERNING FACTOR-like protein 8 [Prosopis cineraria]
MAHSRPHPASTVAIITVAFIFFFTFLPHKSGGGSATVLGLEESKKVIGSRPPACVNKCKKCRPCMATLVVPHHQTNKGFSLRGVPPGDDDPYYLLSWKCMCGNKLFQP